MPPPSKAEPDPQTLEDERWMDLALVHARSGRPSPNPHVGAVIVKNNELVATGHHERAGGEHAETAA
ncbi:MAG: riboflavin biosynthesis protein RibD, partial [Myxococcales bacterium]|nr:riboflavin biosynthesis protein RibD [Myxococcales bacterium]